MEFRENEKTRLEHEAARLFMRCYERRYHEKMRHIWHNQPAKPDVSCYLEGNRLDLEIAHLYGTQQEAMQLLGRSLSEKIQQELASLESQPAQQRLVHSLNRILAAKGAKTYHSERVWLVIRNAHPEWHAPLIRQSSHRIIVPATHPFEQIWMVGDMRAESGIIRLFPNPQEHTTPD